MIIYIFIAIAFLGIINSIRQLYRSIITLHQFIFWVIIWMCVIIGIFLFEWFTEFVLLLGVGRPLDLFVTVAILIIFWMLFRISIRQEQLSQQITLLIRQDAIRNAKKKK